MAGPPLPDGSGDHTNGASDDRAGHVPPQDVEEAQTLADTEQTLSDGDQTSSDSDQTSAEADQLAADRDQAASDRDNIVGGDPEVHRATSEIRAQTTQQRDTSSRDRVDAAAERDAVAHARDLEALARDRAAALHDREQAARDVASMGAESADRLRQRVVADRAAAAESRARAAADRQQAARDRERASRDRAQGRTDRDVLLSRLTRAVTEESARARRRGAGMDSLEKEIELAARTKHGLVLAHIDIAASLGADDTDAGPLPDPTLQRVARAVRQQVRVHDLVFRLSERAFVCAVPDLAEADLRERLATVRTALDDGPDSYRIEVGFATLGADETARDLIDRARADRSGAAAEEVSAPDDGRGPRG